MVLFFLTELISSANFHDLFPGYNGVLPEIKIFSGQLHGNFRNFDGKRNLILPGENFFVRDHIIVGKRWNQYINPPCNLRGVKEVFAVYDTRINHNRWEELSPTDFYALGPNRLFALVEARDQVAAKYQLNLNTEAYRNAHKDACRGANIEADIVENRQLELLDRGQTSIEGIIQAIKDTYAFEYNHVYQLRLKSYGRHPDQPSSSRRGV